MHLNRWTGALMAVFSAGILLSGCGQASQMPAELSEDQIKTGQVAAGDSIHDPMIIEGDDGTFYCYGSHMTEGTTKDLRKFTSVADGVSPSNRIFDNLLTDPFDAFSYVGKNDEGGYSVWAPSVIYDSTTKKYLMVFCTTSSYIKSDICYATADDIGGPYHYGGKLLYSGFTRASIDKTNFEEIEGTDKAVRDTYVTPAGFNNQLWPNCIDPALFYDADGRLWMVYGSWSGGIFVIEMDPETYQLIHPETDEAAEMDSYYGKRLVGGYHHAIEGPYIQYDSDSGYYYLFLSYGSLQADGGYQIRVFRSDKPDGTYTDAKGKTLGISDDLDHYEKYGLKLMGNYTLPSLDCTYMAPGGQSTFSSDGKLYIVYHQRFKNRGENHEPRVHEMLINSEGWPVVLPFAAGDETKTGGSYTRADVQGTFYLLNHGLKVSKKVNKGKACTFRDGKITGAYEGTYEVKDGTDEITLTIDDVTYSGKLVEMADEAGNATFCFTAAGDNDHSLWGVHYMESMTEDAVKSSS